MSCIASLFIFVKIEKTNALIGLLFKLLWYSFFSIRIPNYLGVRNDFTDFKHIHTELEQAAH